MGRQARRRSSDRIQELKPASDIESPLTLIMPNAVTNLTKLSQKRLPEAWSLGDQRQEDPTGLRSRSPTARLTGKCNLLHI